MLVSINGAKCVGIDAVKVVTEVEITKGIGIHLVGLADIAVKESLLRTTTALQALDYHIPGKRIVINLAPADLHKSGSGYDLGIALGIVSASGQRVFPNIGKYIIMGELGLDGSIRDVAGALPFADLARKSGLAGLILPVNPALEASEFTDLAIFGIRNFNDAVKILEEKEDCSDLLVWNTVEYRKATREQHHSRKDDGHVDFSEIFGQEGAKRGMEIAAAGGHNIMMIGPPGSGKSSIAKALPGILPPMTSSEALVTSKIFSIAGKYSHRCGLMSVRPFRSPHYSASVAAIIGGGAGDSIIPGEISLAQNGVLFLDEMGQMPRSVIEALRGPLEDRAVSISRLRSKVEYPASFMLVAASNPCPCGYWGEGDRCTCTPSQRLGYLSKLSGPIMDRIDIQIVVKSLTPEEIEKARNNRKEGLAPEPSSEVAKRVLKARECQKIRFMNEDINTNAEMSNRHMEKYCALSEAAGATMTKIMQSMELSMRAYFRIIKVARTIADLDGSEEILSRHLIEAAGYRFLDRQRTI